jgi:hypothetical protein
LKNIEKLCLKDIAAVTRIPDEILKGWRRHLLTDREWRPYQHCNAHFRWLTVEQKAEVLQETISLKAPQPIIWEQNLPSESGESVQSLWNSSQKRPERERARRESERFGIENTLGRCCGKRPLTAFTVGKEL